MTVFSSSRFYHRKGVFVNPRDDTAAFGTLGLGSDAAVFQAAIDYAFNNFLAGVYIPDNPNSNWVLEKPVFQDAPGNLRNGISAANILNGVTAAPTIHGRHIAVEFDPGTKLKTSFQTGPAWWIGSGSDNVLRGPNIINNVNTSDHSRTRPVANTGIAIASGGSVNLELENIRITGFYTGVRVGQNDASGSLAENNLLKKVIIGSCYKGVWFENGQGLVNLLVDCNVEAVKQFVSSSVPYVVIGGEHGLSGDQSVRKKATMSSVSTLSTFTDVVPGGQTFTNFTFTTTISSPQTAYWQDCPDGGRVYDRATINLPSFGIVPLIVDAYSAGVATFRIHPGWTWYHYGEEVALNTGTDFNTELQACTTVYAVCRGIFAQGPGRFIKPHLENLSANALIDIDNLGYADYSGGPLVIDQLEANSDPTMSQYAADTGDDISLFYCMAAHPYIRQASRSIILRDCEFGNSAIFSEPTVIEGFDGPNNHGTTRLIVDNSKMASPNLRYVGDAGSGFYIRKGPGYDDTLASRPQFGSKAGGFGEWEETPWGPHTNASTPNKASYFNRASGTNKTRYQGFFPARGETQRLTVADVTAIEGAATLGTRQMICGGRICCVEELGTVQTYTHVKDNGGDGFSYYGDLTISWSYKGQSHLVTVSGTHVGWLFAGMEIGLDNGGGVVWYMVTGVYPALGYITVYRKSTSASVLTGTKTTTYTGSTIKQRTASLQKFGAPV